MPAPGSMPADGSAEHGSFPTTHWSVVLAAGHISVPGAEEALEALCRTYWYPLYAYVRRKGHSVEEAQDLTQGFFLRLLEKGYLALADRERGRFRAFLLTAMQRFLISEWRRSQSAKRGGPMLRFWDGAEAETRYQCEPATDMTPERVYERRRASLLLENVLARLREEAARANKLELFEGLKSLLWGDAEAGTYTDLARSLKMSEGALRIAAHRFRQRYREVLRAEIAQTVAQPADIDDEMRHLFEALG